MVVVEIDFTTFGCLFRSYCPNLNWIPKKYNWCIAGLYDALQADLLDKNNLALLNPYLVYFWNHNSTAHIQLIPWFIRTLLCVD